MGRHTNFILSPTTDILVDVVTASSAAGVGMSAFPLSEYVMQSTFLKMTGFSEQKLKCICWELATDDYEYRYDFMKKSLGEFSDYKAKNTVYQDLIIQITKFSNFNVADIGRNDIFNSTLSSIETVFDKTAVQSWTQEAFDEYHGMVAAYQPQHFAGDANSLFVETPNPYPLRKIFIDYLYRHRNRCAHNLLSYQENLPAFKTLTDPNYRYNNYYLWFMMLTLMDNVYIALYKKYLQVFEES